MRLLNRALIAFGMVSLFCLGVVSVSFANRVPSGSGPLRYEKFNGSLKDKLPQMDSKTLKTGMLFEEDGELPKLPQDQSPLGSTHYIPLPIGQITFSPQIALTAKVSTCIFQSALNL